MIYSQVPGHLSYSVWDIHYLLSCFIQRKKEMAFYVLLFLVRSCLHLCFCFLMRSMYGQSKNTCCNNVTLMFAFTRFVLAITTAL